MGRYEELVASRIAKYREEQKDSSGRCDLQKLSELVSASLVVRVFDIEWCKGIQSLVFTKRWRVGCGIMQECIDCQLFLWCGGWCYLSEVGQRRGWPQKGRTLWEYNREKQHRFTWSWRICDWQWDVRWCEKRICVRMFFYRYGCRLTV